MSKHPEEKVQAQNADSVDKYFANPYQQLSANEEKNQKVKPRSE